MIELQTADEMDNGLDVLSTGVPSIDKLTGIGGFPRGKVTLLSGAPSVGKSTLSLLAIREAQKQGLKPILFDVEYSYDSAYAAALGVDPKKLWVIRERFGEEGLDKLEEALDSGEFDLAVIDSIGALLPRAEAEKSADQKTIGGQAGMVSRFMRKIVPILVIKKVALVCLTHEFLDIMSGAVKTSGGAKLSYSTSLHLRLRKVSKRVMQGDRQVGEIIEAEVKKNKISNTMKQKVELTTLYGEGFSIEADLLQELLDSGEVTKKGNSYFRGEIKLGVGLAKAREALKI